jgi:MFS family permease
VPGALAGSALAAGLVVDAFLDPLIGPASDGWRWKLTTAQIQGVTLAIFVGLVLGAPIAGPMLKRMEKTAAASDARHRDRA